MPSPRASRDLRAEHVHVMRMLKILEAIRTQLAAGGSPPHEEWVEIVSFLRVFVDRCHHGKEERVLFPAMMLVADEETKTLIEELLVEHVEGRALLAALAAATVVGPTLPGDAEGAKGFDAAGADKAIAGYVALIRPHVMHEEKRLYPIADMILAPELQETLQSEYEHIDAESAGARQLAAFEESVMRLRDKYLPARSGSSSRQRKSPS